jgi:hypothetical protein
MPVALLSIICALLIAGASSTQSDARNRGASTPHSSFTSRNIDVANSMEECTRPDVTVEPTTLPANSVDAATAPKDVAGLGVKGAPAIAVPALVTVGTTWMQQPTSGAVLKDAHGVPILARPAWALVFRNQSIPRPGGPARPRDLSTPKQMLPPVTVVAAIVDASTGEFLRGWGC